MPRTPYRSFSNPYAGTISEILLRRGDIAARGAENLGQIQARAAETRGNAWAGAANTIGDLARGIPLQIERQREQAAVDRERQARTTQVEQQTRLQADADKRDKAGRQLLSTLTTQFKRSDPIAGVDDFDYDAIMRGMTEGGFPEEGQQWLKGATDTAEDREKINAAKRAANTAIATAVGNAAHKAASPDDFLLRLDHLTLAGGIPLEARKQFATEVEQGGAENWTAIKQRYVDWADSVVKPITTRPGEVVRAGVSGTAIAETPQKPPPPPNVGSFEDYVTRKFGPNPTPDQIEQARKAYQQADDRPVMLSGMNALYDQTDAASIAQGIREGTMPPDISQYGRPVQGAIASALTKPGPNGERFDLASAQRTWKAQLRLNATMNGGQQVRLDESIRSGLAMYDRIDEIADRWDGKGWGPLSRANLTAAREGLKGPKAQAIANELTGQIGQLTSDVATIEQGGLTPTNESRAIAEKSMQDWWGKGTIKAMTAQGRMNMRIRELARVQQPIFASGNAQPYTAPPPMQAPYEIPSSPSGAGLIEARDPQGAIHHAPAGTPLPRGWTLVTR